VGELRKSIVAEYSRYDRGVKKLSLADLNIPNVKTDVLSLNEDEVRATIERVITQCVRTIVAGHGFQYEVPVRSSGNILYVPELDRIVLKDRLTERMFASLKNGRKTAITTRILGLLYELCLKRIHVTKRDLFYVDVKLFEKQETTDDVIEDVACMLGCTRASLNGQTKHGAQE
jgi:meiotic recombination protein SPO11